MILKYILKVANKKIAIKYIKNEKTLIIGGLRSYKETIKDIINVYFDNLEYEIKEFSIGKLRFYMQINKESFDECISDLSSSLWLFQTDNHGRLMR